MTVRAWMGRLLVLLGLLAVSGASPLSAQQPGGRVALVIGNGAYAGQAALPTAANDAGLVAQTLTAAGFDVTGARDLDGDSLRRAIREFLDKASTAGPTGIAFVYLSGYALQFDGENFFVPVDATLARDSDIPLQAIRLSDVTHALTGLPLQARVVVVDGAYTDPLVPPSDHIAPGLALVEAEAGSLVAFNAAPGTVAPTPSGAYGVYGQALAEMMRQGGVAADEVFDRVRLRVNETTRGAAVPWDSARLTAPFTFLDQAPDAPATAIVQQSFAGMSKRAIREFPAPEAYSLAVARDTFPAYQDFLTAYPQDPNAKRVRALLALRREALIWRQTVNRNSAPAYWTYLRRYPRGPHVYDCRRRLAMIAAAEEPPESFAPIDYDVPPPPEVEYRIVERPTVYLDDVDDPPPPPPPPPVYFLPPEQPDFVDLAPPPPAIGPGFLPIPVPVPFLSARPNRRPGFIAPPRGFQGQYAQPQPFATDPDGRLVARPGPQGPGPGEGNPPGAYPPGQRGPARPDEGSPRNPGGQPGFAPAAPQLPRPGVSFGPPVSGQVRGPGFGQGLPPQPGGPAGNPGADQQQLQQQQREQRQQQEQQLRLQLQQQQQRQQQDQQQRLQQDQQRQQQEQQLRLQQQRQQQEQQQRSQQEQQLRLQQQRQQQEQQLRLQQQQRQQQEQQQRSQQQQRQQQEQQLRLQQQRQQQDQQQRSQQQQRQQQEQQLRLQQQRQQQEQQQQQSQQRQQEQLFRMQQQQRQQQDQQRAQQQQFQQRQQQEQQFRMQRQQQDQQRAQQQQFQQRQQPQFQQRQPQEDQRQGRPNCGSFGQPPCR